LVAKILARFGTDRPGLVSAATSQLAGANAHTSAPAEVWKCSIVNSQIGKARPCRNRQYLETECKYSRSVDGH
jgi:hypothetical protein